MCYLSKEDFSFVRTFENCNWFKRNLKRSEYSSCYLNVCYLSNKDLQNSEK